MFDDLVTLFDQIKNKRILDLFEDKNRADNFSVNVADLHIDYSKTLIDDKILDALISLANDSDLAERRNQMLQGEKINYTENRAVLHTALRAPKSAIIKVDGKNVMPEIHAVYRRMKKFSDSIRNGEMKSSAGEVFTDIVNIGIGGSDLGPAMAVRALSPYHDGPNIHFVSNIDSAHIHDVLSKLNPKRTLILIASKTFTTIETMTNAETAKKWLEKEVDSKFSLAAISTSLERTKNFGILDKHVFGFEDWVGGRYSLWGPIGLSVMLAIGCKNFDDFLGGAQQVDEEFMGEISKDNAAVIMAMIGIWHRNICGYETRAILPYEERLSRFPAYLQQLDMESNGKSVSMLGEKTSPTGPIVWGEPGTNGQHAFYQLLHQGTNIVPCEFLVGANGFEEDLKHQHQLLIANCLAQSRALMIGRSFEEALEIVKSLGYTGDEADIQARHRIFEGNRPSITIVYPKLTPSVLGQLIALYEHRVFVEGVIWGINSFDQWGVELGKALAVALTPALQGEQVLGLDASTNSLIEKLKDNE